MKLKTHRGAAKRFKMTKTGKVMRAAAYKSHILTSKSPKKKRRMRKSVVLSEADAPKVRRMLPYSR